MFSSGQLSGKFTIAILNRAKIGFKRTMLCFRVILLKSGALKSFIKLECMQNKRVSLEQRQVLWVFGQPKHQESLLNRLHYI